MYITAHVPIMRNVSNKLKILKKDFDARYLNIKHRSPFLFGQMRIYPHRISLLTTLKAIYSVKIVHRIRDFLIYSSIFALEREEKNEEYKIMVVRRPP